MGCSDEINTWLMTASPLSEEERETFAKVMVRVSLSGYGRADMPGNTIIAGPCFSAIVVPVTTQARVDEVAAQSDPQRVQPDFAPESKREIFP